MSENSKLGILAIGHGSKLPYNKQVVTDIANRIADKHEDVVVRAGFMEKNEPTVEEALQSFEGTGISKIAAVPVFLASGVHITQDIPEILGIDPDSKEGSIKLNGTEIPIVYGNPLGSDDLLAELVYNRAQEALD
ncbi:cobalamin (vitamin B12) biosynthesis CbiX protein [Methanohalobium evestigatum Z-7303]|uniref:Sirohydrochlorin cobaltochelatase n=1 Tax=Methanohalobium evestigatum (strain ATCC BAA-1072 / DSM 3721 / NBRC 107634 / OCM 161 / Z-7303) TaxID=644295 RepID=D7E8C7_METEZ|nr:sirohydrochlorin nickelochelatase [Methanohalobium evestigatum]ADI73469.1 cobalamin (vitamin B12) biosynthesis CbiX protein [Methanohalobium evestigatum Z-7303]